jgi:hypothetical protein
MRYANKSNAAQAANPSSRLNIWMVAQKMGFTANARLSRPLEIRCGTKGSVSLDLTSDEWFDHEAEQGGDAIALVMRELGLARTREGYADAFRWLEDAGLHAPNREPAEDRARRHAQAAARKRREEAATRAKAWVIFKDAKPLTGSDPASLYLAGRAIDGPYPEALRCASLWNAEVKRNMAALVAAVTSLETPHALCAVQRIFLEDGRKADVPTPKKALGAIGGAGVVLGPIVDAMVVAEGVETALSAARAFGLPAVATLGAGNMRALIAPPRVQRVVIAADRDQRGAGERAARDLCERLAARGVDASIVLPPEPHKDFNDAAQALAKGGARG